MIHKTIALIRNYLVLGKAGISISVAFTTAAGYVLSSGKIDSAVIPTALGVYLLAMSASIINQIIELKADSLMPRTMTRPLVNLSITVKTALLLSIILGVVGMAILYICCGTIPAILGLFTHIWYNAVYTPLKYRTAFAAFPGGVSGAIPPLIGWISGGGAIMHHTAIALATFLFIGQIPHFWLIILKYGEEYKKAGIKTITERLTIPQIKRLVLVWVITTAIAGCLLTFFLLIRQNATFYSINLLSLALFIYFLSWYIKPSMHYHKAAFILINVYYLLVLLLLVLDVIFHSYVHYL